MINPIPTIMHRVFVFLMSLILLVACSGDPQVTALLDRVDSLTYEQPDSALRLLQQHEAEASAWTRSQRMRHALLTARAQNKAFVDFTTDSVLLELTDYYDRHGTPNQQMEAHYLLGCVYRDLGEAPRAIDAWQDAIDRADTTATDCDYATLCGICSQMAYLFYLQNLLSENLSTLDQSIVFANHAHDTIAAINAYAYKMITYDRMSVYDSVVQICDSVYRKVSLMGDSCLAAQYACMGINAMLEQEQTEKAKRYFDSYEKYSGFFDEENNIIDGREAYYNLKGRYFISIHQYDSAEFYFRKELRLGLDFMNQNMASQGLAQIFKESHISDSAAKYALYSYSMNDSVYAHMATEEVERTKAIYNYTSHQREAQLEKERADAARSRVRILLYFIIGIVVACSMFIRMVMNRRKVEKKKYHVAIVERNKLQKEVERLNAKDYDTVIAQKEQEIALLNQTIERQSTIYHRVTAGDRLSDFEKSPIVQVFHSKRTYHKEQAMPTGDEWKKLVSQFREDMPSAYATMSSLSPLQLQVCILLIMGFEEGEIAYMHQSRPQVISNAKARANQKLFLSGDSVSLKGNLMELIASGRFTG